MWDNNKYSRVCNSYIVVEKSDFKIRYLKIDIFEKSGVKQNERRMNVLNKLDYISRI